MRVEEIMTRAPPSCLPLDTLDVAVRIMAEENCRAVPVVDETGRALGVITSRDVCAAGYFRQQALHRIRVHEAMSMTLVVCREDDPVTTAEAVLREHHLHRVPVVDAEGRLVGLVARAAVAPRATEGTTRGATS